MQIIAKNIEINAKNRTNLQKQTAIPRLKMRGMTVVWIAGMTKGRMQE